MAQHRIGVIADTHGLLRTQAVKALQGVDLIIHAGDIGNPQVLAGLQTIAPVVAVRGNTDRGEWAHHLPLTAVAEVGDTRLYVLHELFCLDLDPAAAGFGAVICGHSHEPRLEWHNGVMFLNPGAAGPRRWTLPVTLALLKVAGNALEAEYIKLKV